MKRGWVLLVMLLTACGGGSKAASSSSSASSSSGPRTVEGSLVLTGPKVFRNSNTLGSNCGIPADGKNPSNLADAADVTAMDRAGKTLGTGKTLPARLTATTGGAGGNECTFGFSIVFYDPPADLTSFVFKFNDGATVLTEHLDGPKVVDGFTLTDSP